MGGLRCRLRADYNGGMGSQWVAEHFQQIQIAIVIVVVLYFGSAGLRSRAPKSQFRVREADRADLEKLRSGPSLADAKLKGAGPKAPPLSLPGIRLEGEPHEILGVAPDASEMEILRAYKDAIKKYHPDRIQGPAQEQLKFYQEAAAKLNEAKEALLKRRR